MVYTHDDKDPSCERRVSNTNACFEQDDDNKGVCYDNVEPDEMENGVVASSNFGSIAVVDSTNVHFGNKTYYQGPVTVLAQTIVSSGEVQKTCEVLGVLAPTTERSRNLDVANKSAIEKVRLALCPGRGPGRGPGSKRRQLIAAALAGTGVILLLIIYLPIAIGRTSGRLVKDNSGSQSLEDTGDGTVVDVYTNSPNAGPDDILDGNFLRIRPRTEWLAQPPVEVITDLQTPVPNVIISHSATEGCFTTAECVVRVRTIQTFHIEGRGWSDIGYNYLVGGEGAVYEGRGWDKVGAHSLGWNNVSIGICIVGTFTTIEPTPVQLTATQRLIVRGVKLGKISPSYRLLAQKQVQSTESPGRLMFAIMQSWPHWYNTSVPQD